MSGNMNWLLDSASDVVSGALVMAVGWVWQGRYMLGIVVGVSLLLAFVVSTSLASTLPILFNRLKIDPAVAAGPFVSTAMDIVGIAIYLTLATTLLDLPCIKRPSDGDTPTLCSIVGSPQRHSFIFRRMSNEHQRTFTPDTTGTSRTKSI